MIDNRRSTTLFKIIKRKVQPDSIVYSDSYRSYNILDVSEFKQLQSKAEFYQYNFTNILQ